MSQNEQVLDYMRTHGSIDQLRATRDLMITRLPARINDLRKLGVKIVTVTKYRRDESGKVVTKWAEYHLA